MKNLKSIGISIFSALFLLLSVLSAQAQVQTARNISIVSKTKGFYEYLPQGYTTSQKYPLIIFIHGMGELGNGGASLPDVLRTGLPRLINQGKFPTSFVSGGKTHKFIVISPQFNDWPSADDINAVVNYAIDNYSVNANRIYVTGLSMGGGATWNFAGDEKMYGARIAGIVPICGASYNDRGRSNRIADNRVPVWATHNSGDPTVALSQTTGYVNQILERNPSHPAKYTIFQSSSHDAWTKTYDPAFKEGGMNIYEWMLQYERGVNLPASNQPPVAKAGADQTITLPVNSVQVSGSGSTDVGGSISAYKWTKSSGPSTYTFSNSSAVNTTISNLVAGAYTFRLTVTDNQGLSTHDDVEIIVKPNIATTPSAPVPGKIEAEKYVNFSGVQTESTKDAGGGIDVGWIDNGDWMDYKINVAATGTYTVKFRVASGVSGGKFQLKKSDGTVLYSGTVPNTGGYQTWQTVTGSVSLTAGEQIVRLQSTANPVWNTNWMEFTSSPITPPPPPTNTPGVDIPSRIQAESYTSMSGVQQENTKDAGGGKDVGYIDNGDWMDFAINAPAQGNYTVNFRIATPNSGVQFQVRNAAGTVLATVSVPKTGGYQTWQSVAAQVSLPAGAQTLRIHSTSTLRWNFNWMEFSAPLAGTPTPTPAEPIVVQAEAYTSMSGVQTENTRDAGGGKNVGWIDNGDWMDFAVNMPDQGSYTVNFRISTPNSGVQFQIKNAAGTVLATVAVPVTGGYQQWRTVSTQLTLPAGAQTLRLHSTANLRWNINWMEFVQGGTIATAATSAAAAETLALSGLHISPNPVADRFMLQVSNDLTGAMLVQILDAAGEVKKEFNFNKTSQSSTQLYLSAGDLAAGEYTIRVQMGQWTQSLTLNKQ